MRHRKHGFRGVLTGIGMALAAVGVSSLDSEKMLYPAIIMLVGLTLMFLGVKE